MKIIGRELEGRPENKVSLHFSECFVQQLEGLFDKAEVARSQFQQRIFLFHDGGLYGRFLGKEALRPDSQGKGDFHNGIKAHVDAAPLKFADIFIAQRGPVAQRLLGEPCGCS